MSSQIAILDYRAGNMASVQKAFEHLGKHVIVTSSPMDVCRAEKIVLPGVGHFDSTRTLDAMALREPILDAISAGAPFLGICVGMQWMYNGSVEAPGVIGLGLLDGMCERFPANVKSPHVGWNTLRKTGESKLLNGIANDAYVYFTHSYRAPLTSECIAATEYGGEFSAAVEHNNIFGVQFHPEKSGDIGLQILRNFCEL